MDDVHDCMDAGGRVTQEQLSRMHKCRERQEVGSDRTRTSYIRDEGNFIDHSKSSTFIVREHEL